MPLPSWRVAVTRDEGPDGPLTRALVRADLTPVRCPVLVEAPPADPAALAAAAAQLADYAWVVFASARGVRALVHARPATDSPRERGWPTGIRTAAVGAATAQALTEAGVVYPPVVGDGDGAEALWRALAPLADWTATRVLVVTTSGGRAELIDALRAAGARVDAVEAYRMAPRPAAAIAADWATSAPDAAVVASPRVADRLAEAVGAATLARLSAVVAIGRTTARALDALGVRSVTPPRADFTLVARTLADLRAAEATP